MTVDGDKMRFEFATSAQIIFGEGAVKEAGGIAAYYGRHSLVVSGQGAANPQELLSVLVASGLTYSLYEVTGEPTIKLVENGIQLARLEKCDLIIGFGGGSCLDTAKAIGGMLINPGELLDYLEVIGQGKKLTYPGVPVIAIPTTAGTGAEVTRNAVLASPENRVKVSLRSPFLLPKCAIVDPVLTYSLPPEVTASTGMDALTQLIEPYVSIRSNPLTDALCIEGISKCARSIIKAYRDGSGHDARESMSLASLLGGLALANAGLGAVHGFASVIGGMCNAPHGAVCARLLAPVMEANIKALSAAKREPQSGRVLSRYDEIARILTADPSARAVDGCQWVEKLQKELAIPELSAYGIRENDFDVLIEKTLVASSTKANPVNLTSYDLREILVRAS
jgi:alcohol dehydrogenase class IV